MKRKLDGESLDELETPKRQRLYRASRATQVEDGVTVGLPAAVTPEKRRRGRPPGSKNKPVATPNGTITATNSPAKGIPPTETDTAKDIFSTPKKTRGSASQSNTPTVVHNADRSARRKSARTLIQRTISGGLSDEDDLDEEDTLARRIWNEDEEDDSSDEDGDLSDGLLTTTPAETPSKRPRGRPKGSRNKKRTPTPPTALPPQERYFFQNRPSGTRNTSNHTLASLTLLTHATYFPLIETFVDPHLPERSHLENLHARSSFGQWWFEMSEGFSVCLYGFGSKRGLVMRFAEWLERREEGSKIVVVNGYLPNVGVREVMNTIATAVLGQSNLKLSGPTPAEMLESLLSLLTTHQRKTKDPKLLITLLIHSLDSPSLRPPNTQSLLSTLSTHPAIRLLCTTDHPTAPLLWPTSLRESYNFLFHDTTTFAPYDAEIDVVDTVEEVLGRKGRRAGDREGLMFVLRSLPGNARRLFGLLISELLAMSDGGNSGDEDDDCDEYHHNSAKTTTTAAAPRTANRPPEPTGIPYPTLYQKATQQFICTSDLAFRTLLKEFHDHQMLVTQRDPASGAESLHVPFSREELEVVLEDLLVID
ncbi:MAG: Origin recognition complex subunit 2 [Trichoglossum hirsutum]|nr:MAG: Origin recognition complex subunit 2 [Trichoglossum hirsutum]